MKLRKYIPEIIILFYAILFLLTKNPSNQWDRVIVSDGKGYYAYLTSFFIYHDTDFGFIDRYESDYYPAGRELYKDFRYDTGKGIVNKYFPGLAILWLPFFAAGHASAAIFSYPLDGYSMPYQLSIAFAALFYFWLSLLILRRILRFYTENENVIAWIIVTIALATNLIYYTVNNGSQVHVYNFFLINVFIYAVLSAIRSGKPAHFVIAAFTLGMIIICRPQNGLILLSVPFLSGSRKSLSAFIRRLFANNKILFPAIGLFLVPLLIPMAYWYAETGRLLVYSYGDETYDLTNPHLWKFLFSFEKGWLLYTPVALLALSGFIFLYKRNKWQFYSLFVFLFFIIYFLSSWWIWNYTSFVSQRVMIDYYAFVAILLVFVFHWIENRRKQILFPVLLIFITGFNIMQHFQHLIWVYPAGPVTAGSYFGNFFRFSKGTTYLVPESEILSKQTFKTGFDSKESFFQSDDIIEDSDACSGKDVLEIVSGSGNKLLFVREMALNDGNHPVILKIGGKFKPESTDSVFNFEVKTGSFKKKFSAGIHNFMPGLIANRWNYAEMAVYLPFIRSVYDSLFISVQNLSKGKVLLDDIQVELLTMKRPEKLDWIPAVFDPVDSVCIFRTNLDTPVHSPWNDQGTLNSAQTFSGKYTSRISLANPYSAGFEGDINKITDGYIRVNSMIKGDSPSEVKLVFDFIADGKTIKYWAYPVTFGENGDQWITSEIFREFPVPKLKADKVKIYYWYKNGANSVYIDDIQVDIVKYKPSNPQSKPLYASGNGSKTILEICCNFENECQQMSGLIIETSEAYSGKKVNIIQSGRPYSYNHILPLTGMKSGTGAFVQISARGYSDHYSTEAILVADFKKNGKSYYYQPFYIQGLTVKGEWVPLDFKMVVPGGLSTGDSVLIYFYLPENDEVFMIDDFCVSLREPKGMD